MYNFCNAKSSLVRKREKGRHHEWALRKVAFQKTARQLSQKKELYLPHVTNMTSELQRNTYCIITIMYFTTKHFSY